MTHSAKPRSIVEDPIPRAGGTSSAAAPGNAAGAEQARGGRKAPRGRGAAAGEMRGLSAGGAGEGDGGVGSGFGPGGFIQPVHLHPGWERECARFV